MLLLLLLYLFLLLLLLLKIFGGLYRLLLLEIGEVIFIFVDMVVIIGKLSLVHLF